MTKWCAVPNCKTGSRTEQIKRSLFRVPKDPATWKKWCLRDILPASNLPHQCE